MPKEFELILFDFDGTTIDTDKPIVETFYELYDLYNNGLRRPYEEILYFSGPPIKDTLKKEFPTYDLDFMFNEYKRISPKYYEMYVKPYPHVIEVINELINRGYKVGAVTNKRRVSSLSTLKLCKMDNLFHTLVSINDVSVGKPNPEGIIKAMHLESVLDKNKVIYVGDNTSDYLASKNAGIKCILCDYGAREISKDITPYKKIKKFEELLDLLP